MAQLGAAKREPGTDTDADTDTDTATATDTDTDTDTDMGTDADTDTRRRRHRRPSANHAPDLQVGAHAFLIMPETTGFPGKCLVNVGKPHALPW